METLYLHVNYSSISQILSGSTQWSFVGGRPLKYDDMCCVNNVIHLQLARHWGPDTGAQTPKPSYRCPDTGAQTEVSLLS